MSEQDRKEYGYCRCRQHQCACGVPAKIIENLKSGLEKQERENQQTAFTLKTTVDLYEKLKGENKQLFENIERLKIENERLKSSRFYEMFNQVISPRIKELELQLDTANKFYKGFKEENECLKAQLQNRDKASQDECCEVSGAKLTEAKERQIMIKVGVEEIQLNGTINFKVESPLDMRREDVADPFMPFHEPTVSVKCPNCNGAGKKIYTYVDSWHIGHVVECPHCNGTGNNPEFLALSVDTIINDSSVFHFVKAVGINTIKELIDHSEYGLYNIILVFVAGYYTVYLHEETARIFNTIIECLAKHSLKLKD
jgi:hypothetical protein